MNAEVYLDSTLVDLPEGLNEVEQTLTYEDEVCGVVQRIESTLIFGGDGYDYIYGLLTSTGFCNEIAFQLKIGNPVMKEYFNGIIHVADMNEANVSRGTIKVPIANNDFSSYIYNNKKVKAYLNVTKSKNGDTITAATAKSSFDLFTPSTGVYDLVTSWAYTVDQAFNYLVAFMSDGNMTYSSPFFGTGGAQAGLCIMSGFALRNTGATAAPFVSFYDLFTEMNKLYNIGFYIDYSGASPKIVIDTKSSLYTTTALMTFSDIRDVVMTIEKDKLYAKVTMGSSKVENDSFFTFPDVRFLGFNEEEYHVLGQCNQDLNLDLKNDYIIDSNVIEDVIINANDAYDDDIFIIESDLPTTEQATQYPNILNDGTFIYNLGLNNFNKSQNYLGGFPDDLLLFLNNDLNSFEATRNSYTLTTGNNIHPTEISDPGGNYDNVTGRFAAPIGGDGVYSFTFEWTGLALTSATAGANMGDVYIRHYDSGGVLQSEVLIKNWVMEPVTDANQFGAGSASFYMVGTDYVRCEGVATTGTITFGLTTFSGIYDEEGGTYQAYNSNDYKILNIEFESPLTLTQYENIRDNITDRVTVETAGGQTFYGWIKNVKRNILTGMSKIILRTSNNRRI